VSEEITAAALLAEIDAGTAPVIVDVRSRFEFRSGHVPGAAHVPFWMLRWRMRSIPARPSDRVVVYCGHGPRAWLAAQLLRRRGFTRIVGLTGQFSKWRSAGLREGR